MKDFEQDVLVYGFSTDNFTQSTVATYKLFYEDEFGNKLAIPELRMSIDGSPFFPIDHLVDTIPGMRKRLIKTE